MREAAETGTIKYRAFLSYSHRDKTWAKWLHSALEAYRIDKDLVGRPTTVGPVPKTLRPIFRDREDFSAGHSLTAQTLAALEVSQFLIVICSPNAARSHYVNEEILRFKALGRGERIIPIIVDGEPGDPKHECFPPALRFKLGPDGTLTDEHEEPLAADARPNGDGKEIAKQKLVAALLGLGLDEIVQRAERAQKRRNRIWGALASIFLLLAVTATGSAVYAWQQLKTNERFLDATLKRATEIVKTAVDAANKYNVPRAATLELLKRAEGLFDDMAQLGAPTPELNFRKAVMQIEFARNYSSLGDTRAAQSLAQSAIDLIGPIVSRQPSNFETQFALADARMQLGHSLDIQGQLDVAIAQFEISLSIGQRFSASANSDDFRPLVIMSIANERIGDILRKQGKFAQGAEYYRANMKLAERLTVSLPEALEKMAAVLEELGDRDAAIAHFRRMQAVVQRLAAQSSGGYFTPIIASSHQGLGRLLLAQGKLSEALKELRASLAIEEQRAIRDRSDTFLQAKEAHIRGMIEEVLLAQGRGSIEGHMVRLSTLQRLASRDPRDVYLQINLANAHELLADLLMAEGRYQAARSYYRTGHGILQQVVVSSPNDVNWQLLCLWSHSRLALLGDDSVARFQFIAMTLHKLKAERKLTPAQERWLPFADEGLAAVTSDNPFWQAKLVSVLWRATPITDNPVRQAALLVAVLRKLQQEDKLGPEELRWLFGAEAQLAKFRQL